MLISVAFPANAAQVHGVALPFISKPGATSTKPDSAGIVCSIKNPAVVPPHSIVNLREAVPAFIAYNHTSSVTEAEEELVWIVLPGVALSSTKIGLPSVEPDKGILLNVATIAPN